MISAGILGEDEHVELLEGEIPEYWLFVVD